MVTNKQKIIEKCEQFINKNTDDFINILTSLENIELYDSIKEIIMNYLGKMIICEIDTNDISEKLKKSKGL